MNFVLLGNGPAVVPLIGAVAAHADHNITHAALVEETILSAVLKLAPGIQVAGGWEEWLADNDIDFVIVAGADETVLEAARHLASAGKSLLVVPSVGQGLAFIYEMTLSRDETNIVLCPAFPQRFEPAVAALKRMIDSDELGRLMHLQLERMHQPADAADSPALLSQQQIDEALLHDVDLLRFLGGHYNRVTSVYSGGVTGGYAAAQVVLAGEKRPEASWSLKAMQPGPFWKLMAIGEKQTVVLSRDRPAAQLRCDSGDVETRVSELLPSAGVYESLLANCSEMASGRPASPNWDDLTHAFELVDAAGRSVKRRRTIDVHFEAASERSVFKTQMTAIGCGLLVFTFLAVLAVLVIGALFAPNETVMLVLRGLVFLPLLLFLLLQVLLVVSRPSASAASPQAKNGSDE